MGVGRVNRPTMMTLPGFMARVWRFRADPPPTGAEARWSAHFSCASRRWLAGGCVAVTGRAIHEIRTLASSGVRIVIHP
jgi:hypothetical protein